MWTASTPWPRRTTSAACIPRLRHSAYVMAKLRIPLSALDDRLFFRSNFPPDEHQFRAIEFKWLQFPAARHEIEKLRAIGEADEAFRANHARRQAIRKVFEAIARKNFAGSECERLEFRLMSVLRRCDFSLASNSEQQFRVNPATLGPNNRRGRIDFPQFRFKRLDLRRLDEIDFVQQQDVCAFDLQTCCVAKFRETNEHVGVDD